jgi:hypothetical protein
MPFRMQRQFRLFFLDGDRFDKCGSFEYEISHGVSDVSLKIEPRLYAYLADVFSQLIALPQNAIRIKCYDFEGPMNSIYHYPS